MNQQMFRHQQNFYSYPGEIMDTNSWQAMNLSATTSLPPEVKVELLNRQLWQQFHTETTEMIITKQGRCMFPSIELNVTGLERRAKYSVFLEVAPASRRRQKYVGASSANGGTDGAKSGWTSAGPAEPQPMPERRIYVHPDSPNTGLHWTQHPINFRKLKLTNSTTENRNVLLKSMHKYIPRVWIVPYDGLSIMNDFYKHPASCFQFSETEFIAVTAYQNERIRNLKINKNPFAKGFRKNGQSRCRRKFEDINEEDDEEYIEVSENNFSPYDRLGSPKRLKTSSESESASSEDDKSDAILANDISFDNEALLEKPSSKVESQDQPRLHRPWADTSPTSANNIQHYKFNMPVPFYNFSPYNYYQYLHPSLYISPANLKFRQYSPNYLPLR
ncbi:T-box transcription factor TBX6-like [Prorops nasuta]|uniref:T-box transcription factor TBX6-like n=1 Tax=Prorops nasuta TaxID=863751 RepID=UPI0034CF11B2